MFSTATTIEITPAMLQMTAGQTETLQATVFDQDGEEMTGAAVDWSSTDDAVIEVTAEGVAIAKALGSASVEARADDASGAIDIEVTPPAVGSLDITPAEPDPLRIGRTVRLAVTLYDRQRAPIEGMRAIEFGSSDENIVTVTPEGAVRGVAPGSATVTASSEGAEASVDFTVLPPEVVDVELEPRQNEMVPGDTTTLSATLLWADDVAPAEAPTLAWSIDDPDVATIDSTTGELNAKGPGKAQVTVTVDGTAFDFADAVEVVFDFGAVSAGGAHACGMVRDAIFCWGANDAGQLGRADDQPGRVESDLSFKQVVAGGSHTCAIAEDDVVYCWGDTSSSQFDGAGGPTPVAIDDTLAFASITAGDTHTCGITLDGELYCWGDGTDGRLGSGDESASTTPVMIGEYSAVTLGTAHTCALTATDEAFCWGANGAGQLGLDDTDGPVLSPTAVTGGFAFSNLVAGETHTCGTTTAGATACWGANDSGQVGDATNDPRLTPILVAAPNTMARLTAGPMHTCALTSAGEARCWGAGADGRLGTGSNADATAPTDVSTSETFFTIDAGTNFTCAIATSARPYCWGAGADGQLGDGSGGTNTPVEVTGFAMP
jgi:alpha-tubulin suppressor-like RCC1 family protein